MQKLNIKSITYRSAAARLALAAILCLCAIASAMAYPAERYAAASKMSSGRWVKIKVEQTGMQLITTKQLQQWGFSDPSKVNVYGYGGRLINEVLHAGHPDDMPLQPCVRTSKGIVFYGTGSIAWGAAADGKTAYTRTRNPYSLDSYYFISDCPVEAAEMPVSASATPGAPDTLEAMTTFREHLLHERELASPSNTGRLLLGEDFRSNTQQKFNFDLAGYAGGSAWVNVAFGANTSNGPSSLLISANGQRLPATAADNISAITSSDTFLALTNTTKVVTDPGNRLELLINYSTTGALRLARLDYITVEYDRRLALSGGSLAFHDIIVGAIAYKISGASDKTRIWDVTDPSRPEEVRYQLNGSEAVFTVSGDGYREYVAFNADELSGAAVGNAGLIGNQNIHGMPVPDMLIVSPSEFASEAQRLADLHAETDGMRVYVITPQQLYNEFSSGTPDISAYRKALKMWYDRGEDDGHAMRYCLLMGRPAYDNVSAAAPSFPYIPIWQSERGLSQVSSFSTDDIIGMLDDTDSGFSISAGKLSVGIGRMPVKNASEAAQMVDKVIRYVKQPTYGSWRNSLTLIADDRNNGVHLEQSQSFDKIMKNTGKGSDYAVEKIYLDTYELQQTPTGQTYPEAAERFKQKLSEGTMFISYIGHASPKQWTHEQFFSWTDMNSMSNKLQPFLYTASCEFTRWDDDELSGGEVMWLHPNSGVIGMIASSRTVYIQNNGVLTNSMASAMMTDTPYGRPRLGDIMRMAKNNMSSTIDENRLRFLLMGDPAMALPMPELNVTVEKIDGIDIVNPDNDSPTVGALGTVKLEGSVTRADGSTAAGYDGIVEITLYDAERPITSHGNGEDGKVIIYNDRKTRLYHGRTTVKEGRWQVEMKLPAEIENNYSPALLSLYSYSEDGREANGSSDRLYVYGFDDNAPEDNDGPQIHWLRLNSSTFENGDAVGPSPVVLASFSDPAGINISNAALGHQMSISLDGGIPLIDVADFYSPSASEQGAGTIAYPLTDLEPGDHTLEFTVWDNANNSSTATVDFKVSVNAAPVIFDLTSNANPAVTSVTFMLSHDRPAEAVECLFEVFDLSGKKVWSKSTSTPTMYDSTVNMTWNLRTDGGMRVPRGIYLYRATVTTPRGAFTTMTKKLAVTAER